MNYIFLDLEWNNAYSKMQHRFVNEIIEIGAVKLDENLNEIDTFDVLIQSKITKKLTARFKTLTNISNDEMISGISFEKAIKQYREWVGEDYITLSWSNSDLYALCDNCKNFASFEDLRCIGRYVDLQKYFHHKQKPESKNQVSLSNAATMLGIEIDEMSLHRASDDSKITAEIFRKIYDEKDFKGFITDTSKNNFFERLTYKPYNITDPDSEFLKREYFRFKCSKCGKTTVKTGDWYVRNKQFIANLECKKCKSKFIGRVTAKKLYDGVAVKKMLVDRSKKS